MSSCLTYCTWRDTLSVPSCWDKGQVVDSEEPSCCSHGGGSGGRFPRRRQRAPPQPVVTPGRASDGRAATRRCDSRVPEGRWRPPPPGLLPRPSPWRRACQPPAHLGRRPPLLCAGVLGPRAHLPSSAAVQVLGGASAAQTLQADVARLFLFPLYPRRHISKKYHQERRQSLLPPAAVPGPRPSPADLNPRCLPLGCGVETRPGLAVCAHLPAPRHHLLKPSLGPRALRRRATTAGSLLRPRLRRPRAAPGRAGRSHPGAFAVHFHVRRRHPSSSPEGFLGYLRSFVGPCKLWVLCPSAARSAAGARRARRPGPGRPRCRPAAPFCPQPSLGRPGALHV